MQSCLNFNELTNRWKGLLIYASQRYEIGIMSSEDIYQESLIVLFKVAKKINPDTNPDDFRKMFKTELYHTLSDIVDTHKAMKRDYRKTVSGDTRMRFDDGAGGTLLSYIEDDTSVAPDEYAHGYHMKQLLLLKLTHDQKRCLQQLLNPNSFKNVNKVMADEGTRLRNKIPAWAHARCLGWKYAYTKQVIHDLRVVASATFAQ